MKLFSLPLLAGLALVFTLLPFPNPAPAPSPDPQPFPSGTETPLAVVELFTSQGCSSCPPADAVLTELSQRAAAGEPIVTLSYHVDYWNYLGWVDPFSSPYFSARQTDYTERLGARTYTPQVVVNGRQELVGSRRGEVIELVERALATDRSSFVPTLETTVEGDRVRVTFRLPADQPGHRLSALLVQHHARSAVRRGENRGRELEHRNVVRALEHTPATASGQVTLSVPSGLAAAGCSVVILVQRESDHAVVAAARRPLAAR